MKNQFSLSAKTMSIKECTKLNKEKKICRELVEKEILV